MPLFLVFVVIPLIEIALFVEIGGAIGLWPTLLIVVVSAVIGVRVIRAQGAAAATGLQRAYAEVRDPTVPLAHGALKVLVGGLLIVPGFLTDALGLLLLIPGVRVALMRWMKRRAAAVHGGIDSASFSREPHRYGGGRVIDGEYLDQTTPEDSTADRGPHRPSGWTRPDAD